MPGLRSWLERRRTRDRRRPADDQELGDSAEPRFGYGLNDRPLWSQRDREAEEVRKVLREAGCIEWSDLPPDHDGFAVEGGGDGEPFAVACTLDDPTAARAEVPRATVGATACRITRRLRASAQIRAFCASIGTGNPRASMLAGAWIGR